MAQTIAPFSEKTFDWHCRDGGIYQCDPKPIVSGTDFEKKNANVPLMSFPKSSGIYEDNTSHPANCIFVRIEEPVEVWKKTITQEGLRAMTRLIIPVGATVYVGLDNKRRADAAFVAESYIQDKLKPVDLTYSPYNRDFSYQVGNFVCPHNGYALTYNTCASGIHFFCNKSDAEIY